MIFSLSIIVIFVAVSIYFYFRSERLYHQVIAVKRELFDTKKEAQALSEATALIAQKSEEQLKQRFKKIQEQQGEDKSIDIFAPLINNYARIFGETMRGKGQLHKITQKCYDGFQKGSYRQFTGFINSLDKQISRAWGQNNVSGLITFTELVACHYERSKQADSKPKNSA